MIQSLGRTRSIPCVLSLLIVWTGPNLWAIQTDTIPQGVPATIFEPSPAFPFGRPNPDAPKEIRQFEFMIGAFDCVDRIRNRDGSWKTVNAIWNARYFLNGMGIQDQYWSPDFSTSNIRVFDPAEGVWKVTYFRMPGYFSGVWKGGVEDDRIVLRRNGTTEGPGLTFHQITETGFSWHSGGDDPGWLSTCVRRR